MKKLVHFLLFVIIMIVVNSCATTAYVESSNDSNYNEGGSYYRSFNPVGYDMLYSPSYGYHYYDTYGNRFLFDNFLFLYYPNLGRYSGRNHWDYFGYQQNHYFNRIDRNRNFIQRHEANYSMKRGSNGNYQRSESQVQKNNSTRGSYQNSPQQRGSTIQRGSTSPTRGSYQQNSTQQRGSSVNRSSPVVRQSPPQQQGTQRSAPSSRQQNVQRSTPARSNYQQSPTMRQSVQRSTAPNRGNSTGRRR